MLKQNNLVADNADYSMAPQALEVAIARRTLARVFLTGSGIEVGAGTRPWPLPIGATCFYGDIRDGEALDEYFSESGSSYNGFIDAQSFSGIKDESFDFALSAHVLEHLVDPIGGIAAMARVVRKDGIVMFAIPDKRYTWDEPRPTTTLEHLISDFQTGGDDTRFQSCLEHIRYLHPQWTTPIPDNEQEAEAHRLSIGRGEGHFDTHYHTWTSKTFLEMLSWLRKNLSVELLHAELVVNENIAIMRKL